VTVCDSDTFRTKSDYQRAGRVVFAANSDPSRWFRPLLLLCGDWRAT